MPGPFVPPPPLASSLRPAFVREEGSRVPAAPNSAWPLSRVAGTGTGSCLVLRSTIQGCTGGSSAGALFVFRAAAVLVNSTLRGNSVPPNKLATGGGGFFILGAAPLALSGGGGERSSEGG